MPRGRPKNSASDAPSAKAAKAEKANGNGGNLGFEAQLFLAADKLPKNLEPSDYKGGAGCPDQSTPPTQPPQFALFLGALKAA
jgi:hypothetical protein